MKTHRIAALGVVIAFALMIPFGGACRKTAAPLGRGATLYERHCASCHGVKGDGEGRAAHLLYPKPRDLTSAKFKFRSTASGKLPTDEDLLRTLRLGIPGTAMPAWDRLPESDLRELLAHIKGFSPRFASEKPVPLPISAPPTETAEMQQAGRRVYEEMRCAQCHGMSGRGDGPSAATLRDDKGRPIRPYDFTRGAESMKGGSSREDVYRTFTTGLDGSPMPSFADSLNEQERWALVSYVRSLQTTSITKPLAGTPTLKAQNMAAEPPLDPFDAAWGGVPPTDVPLRPLWARDSWPDRVQVRVVMGPRSTAFRFEWRDAQKNEDLARHQDFRDAVAIQFAPEGTASDYVGLPFIGMGDAKAAVTVWHWKADWQADIDGKTFRDRAQRYPGMKVDKIEDRADVSQKATFLTGLAAGNAFSERERKSPVEALLAKGFGTLTRLPFTEQRIGGRGVWKDGAWAVVMVRSSDGGAPPLRARSLAVAVAVWDGGAGDRDGQKVVSQWLELIIPGQ